MDSLKALKELIENATDLECKWELNKLNIIKKDLEMLKLLKRKRVDLVKVLYNNNVNDYNECVDGMYFRFNAIHLTEVEFETIKDWLENDFIRNN